MVSFDYCSAINTHHPVYRCFQRVDGVTAFVFHFTGKPHGSF
jgi:hypothetical protein